MRYSWSGYWGRQAAGLALAIGATALAIWALPPTLHLARYAVLAIGAAVSVGVILSAYAKADEVILQTHKTAWFWGSMGTLALVPALIIAVSEKILPIPALMPVPHDVPALWFAEGVVALLFLQCVGFLLLWGWYNLRRRL